MAAANAAIPCFLLPQLTWRSTNFQSRAVAPKPSSSFPHPPITSLVPHHRHHQKKNSPPLLPSPLPCTSKPRSSSPASSSLTRPAPFLLDRCHQKSNEKNNAVVSTVASQKSRFSTAPHWGRDHHFDTLKVVQRLMDEGFSEEQSRAMMLVLSDVIEESIQNLTRTMVLREGTVFYLLSFPPLPGIYCPVETLPTIIFISPSPSLSPPTLKNA